MPSTSLVQQLAACFLSDPYIDEYDFISLPATEDSGKDTVSCPFLLENHKLGIATWAVKAIYQEALSTYYSLRAARTEALIGNDKEGPPRNGDADLLDPTTRALLLINADMYSAWNIRKRLLLAGKLRAHEEISFLDIVLRKHSKKGSAWAHRRWCVAHVLEKARSHLREPETGRRTVMSARSQEQGCTMRDGEEDVRRWCRMKEKEMAMTRQIAALFPRNYYAWTQRLWVILQDLRLQDGNKRENDVMGNNELEEVSRISRASEKIRAVGGGKRRKDHKDEEGREKTQESGGEKEAWSVEQTERLWNWATGSRMGDMSAFHHLQQVLTLLAAYPSWRFLLAEIGRAGGGKEGARETSHLRVRMRGRRIKSEDDRDQACSELPGRNCAEEATQEGLLGVLQMFLARNARLLDQYPGRESLWYQRRGFLSLLGAIMRRGCPWAGGRGGGDWPQLSNEEAGGEKARLSQHGKAKLPSLSDPCARWIESELARASHYLQGRGPWEGRAGLMWDVESRRRQRLLAWSFKCWVILRWENRGATPTAQKLRPLREELASLEASQPNMAIPPGYKHLVRVGDR